MKKEKILIVGSGGREHALGYKLQSPKRKLYFAPGNAGTSQLGENLPYKETDIQALSQWALDNQIGLTVVGPEASLFSGIANVFAQKNLPLFGPLKEAAQLETSKAWATYFMQHHAIPHPRSKVFIDVKSALSFVADPDWKEIVIKASGLASGKGVILPRTSKEARQAVKRIMVDKEFGDAGEEVVIQEKLSGPEVSILAFSDGKTIIPLLPAQDHKRLLDGDRGPNTGGMGAYAPVPLVTQDMMVKIQQTILQPTIEGMREEGIPFKGVLFAGLMLTKNGPMVLEYNVRFGDPETQPLMMLLDSDLATILKACITESLHKDLVTFRKGSAACVVLAAEGYPQNPVKGTPIEGLSLVIDQNIQIFHAATRKQKNRIVTDGGRVIAVTALAPTQQQALKNVYSVIGKKGVHFTRMQYRKDIGIKV